MAVADPLLPEPQDVHQSPSATSGPFVGIRVVELATVVQALVSNLEKRV